jgi:hypothetical protein
MDAGQITAAVNQAFTDNGGHTPIDHGQFSSSRYAFLFRPGTYHVDVPVGYYTQVLGLGQKPEEVIFEAAKGVYCEEGDQSDMGGALSTFWRGAENFQTRSDMLWAVSQAAPLRRVIADKAINLAQFVPNVGMGYSSGGFLANVQVGSAVNSASQQQWCARNSKVSSWPQGNWNMAFIGVAGAPASHCGRSGDQFPSVSVPSTPVIAEKPFISIDPAGKYNLHIPHVKRDRVGPDFDVGQVVSFDEVYVAKDTDTAADINAHLRNGLHVVLSPGIYQLEAPLELNKEGQVLLGLGLATLVPAKGTPVVVVGNVDGVRVAGVLLQAGPETSDVLLQWGDGTYAGNADNPGFMNDVFARVGGPNDPNQMQMKAKVMVRLQSGHVVGDNLWLWRADHGVAGIVKGGMNPCDHGLVVTGSHVTMYGLAVEHTLQDLVQWAGDAGETYFFQSELPYDVTQAFGDAGFVGYRVNDTVTSHKGYGVAVYHFFRDFAVTVQRGISVPAWVENSFESPLSVSLTGKGKMLHVLNDRGGTTNGNADVNWYCEKGPFVAPAPVSTTLGPKISNPWVVAEGNGKDHSNVWKVTTPPPPASPVGTVTQAATTVQGGVNTPMTTRQSTIFPTSGPDVVSVTAPGHHGATSDGPGGCVDAWGKCGGQGWSGPTCCVNEYTCVEQGIWYSQCIPTRHHHWTGKDRRPTVAPQLPAPVSPTGAAGGPPLAGGTFTPADGRQALGAEATPSTLSGLPLPWWAFACLAQGVIIMVAAFLLFYLCRGSNEPRPPSSAAAATRQAKQLLNPGGLSPERIIRTISGLSCGSARDVASPGGSADRREMWAPGEV